MYIFVKTKVFYKYFKHFFKHICSLDLTFSMSLLLLLEFIFSSLIEVLSYIYILYLDINNFSFSYYFVNFNRDFLLICIPV